jgi:hypothetical protein
MGQTHMAISDTKEALERIMVSAFRSSLLCDKWEASGELL